MQMHMKCKITTYAGVVKYRDSRVAKMVFLLPFQIAAVEEDAFIRGENAEKTHCRQSVVMTSEETTFFALIE